MKKIIVRELKEPGKILVQLKWCEDLESEFKFKESIENYKEVLYRLKNWRGEEGAKVLFKYFLLKEIGD